MSLLKHLGSIIAHKAPVLAWKRFSHFARKAGIDDLLLVLSFDCDTQEDAKVVLELDARLRNMGVKSVYAVPGELLVEAAETYTTLHERGAEFINHGYTTHTFFNRDRGRYESCFFYDEIGEDAVEQDILRGHQAITDVLGTSPTGFRSPHFGCYQKPSQLTHLHTILADAGYHFSSSTLPRWNFSHGPAFRRFGLWELPVSGWWKQPMNIQDSWSYMAMPGRSLSPRDFLDHAIETADRCRRHNICGILNYYADPSHVHNVPEFFSAVEAWSSVARSATYAEILGGLANE